MGTVWGAHTSRAQRERSSRGGGVLSMGVVGLAVSNGRARVLAQGPSGGVSPMCVPL